MAARDVAKAWQKLTQAQQAESLLEQAHALASRSGINEEMSKSFKALFDALSEHRSMLQESATDSLADC